MSAAPSDLRRLHPEHLTLAGQTLYQNRHSIESREGPMNQLLHKDLIDLSKLARESSELPSMLRELEGTDEEELSSTRWAARFPAFSQKEAPLRWPTRFISAQTKKAPIRR